MPSKPLLVAACVLLVGTAVALAWIDGRDAVSPPAHAAPQEAAPVATAVPPPAETPALRASVDDRTADALRAIPTDAEWIEVAVVDKRTQAPVHGATVRWFDESSEDYAVEHHRLTRPEQLLLRDDIEHLADLGGWRTSTDANGHARVAIAGTATVFAEHDGRFGELLVRQHAAAPAGGHKVELEADRSVQVQVVDVGGAPCGDVMVRIFGGERVSRVARSSEPDGIAVFRHLQRLAPLPDATDENAQWLAKAVVLGHNDAGAPFSIRTPRTEPIVLRLPPCGSVRARAEFAGTPASTIREIVFEYHRYNTSFNEALPVVVDGYAHLRYVALGLDLVAWHPWFGSAKFTGPRVTGQRVDVTVAPVPEHATWTGRLLTHDGTPVADQTFCVFLSSDWRPVWRRARTDTDGRFVVSLWENSAGQHVGVRFEWPPTGEARSRAELAPRTLRSGIENVGDIVPAPPPLVAGGRIRGLDARSLRRVTMRVERHEPSPDNAAAWITVDDLLVDKRPDGAFTIRGTTETGRHRLVVGGAVQPIEPIELALGRDDLSLELDAGHDLAAGVLLPRAVPPELMVVDLVPPPSVSVGPLQRERLAATPCPQHGERHDVQWTAIAAGTYTLELRRSDVATPVLRIADVLVPAPAGGDPRLADIDLRSLVRATTPR